MVVPLADEYQMAFLKRDCVKIFMWILKAGDCSLKKQLDIYFFTETYIRSQDMLNFTADFLSKFSITKLMQQPVYGKLKNKGLILEKRLEIMEKVTTDESVCSLNENVAELKRKLISNVNEMAQVREGHYCYSCGGVGGSIYCSTCIIIIHDNIESNISEVIDEIGSKPLIMK